LERQLLELGAAAAQRMLERAKPLAALVRARMNDRMGFEVEADAWFGSVVRFAREGSEEVRWMQVLALNAWGKRDEALAAFGKVAGDGTLQPEMLAALALSAGDFAYARREFASLPVPADTPRGGAWRDLADRAEAEVNGGDPQVALDFATRALSDLEGVIDSLDRPSERLEMCDDIAVASLYQYMARARLALASAANVRGDAAAAEHRCEAFLIIDRHRSLTLPAESWLARDESMRRWQQATTEHVTAYQRLLAELMTGGTGTPRAIEDMAAAERALVAIEAQRDSGAAGPPSIGRAREKLRIADLQARRPDDAVLLEYQLVGRDLVRCAVTASRVEAAFTRLPRGLEGKVSRLLRACAGGGAATQEESELAAILLEPFAAVLAPAKRVIVVPSGGLTALPFHLLPLSGEPLGATRVVSYLPAAALLLRDGLDRPLARGTARVIGDPEFDAASHPGLARLAGAAIEARRIGELYGTDAVFEAAAARERDVGPKLPGRALLHFAAHGRLDETAPYTSSIVLAGRDELTVSDFIGLQIDTDLAVLSACDTGRGTTTLGGDVIGLTRGLLAAGVKRCVVSLWPVDDVAACVTMVAFHSSLQKGRLSPAAALAQAQEEVRRLNAAEIAARYRAMGGVLGAGQRSTRRGSAQQATQLPVFAEADVDEPLVAESGVSSSARIWAPFILVGC
jgi:CHAT domain-containing protein